MAQQDSKRIQSFHKSLIANIPRQPNNAETLATLEKSSLAEILLLYLNRASRFVPPRVRSIKLEATLTSDPRWRKRKASIQNILEKARSGDDLTSYLSLRVEKEGFFSPKSSGSKTNNKWAEKDFLLNVMGYHHFHLGAETAADKCAQRTGDVLFAQLTRTNFCAIGIFDHSVFKSEGELSADRQRLWKIFQMRSSLGLPVGSAYFLTDIVSSGHNGAYVKLASEYAYLVKNIDPALDDPGYLKSHFRSTPNDKYPEKYKLQWRMDFSDLGVYDEVSNVFCIVGEGLT